MIVQLLSLHLYFWAALAGPPQLPQAQEGDVILLPLKCMLCSAIESQTASIYSHSGVLVRSTQGEWQVAEALGQVRLVPLADFLKRVRPGARPGIFRHRFLERRPSLAHPLWDIFKDEFEGGEFDHLFLWGNRDREGREILYCSEFVAQFLNRILPQPILPAPMDFSHNIGFWERYFEGHGGTVPQGHPGLAPADLERSPNFFAVTL